MWVTTSRLDWEGQILTIPFQPPYGDDGLDAAVDDPGEAVQGRDENAKQRERSEDHLGRQGVAQQHKQAEGQDGGQQRRGRPEVDAQGVKVLAHYQRRQLAPPSLLNLHIRLMSMNFKFMRRGLIGGLPNVYITPLPLVVALAHRKR